MQRVFPERAKAAEQAILQMSRFNPYTMFVRTMQPAFSSAAMHCAAVQTGVDEATVACALERYRLANGEFPENLAALAPRQIAALPHDVITGDALKYRCTDNGKFILYSVGWNEIDDHGAVVERDSGTDLSKGDWVWE